MGYQRCNSRIREPMLYQITALESEADAAKSNNESPSGARHGQQRTLSQVHSQCSIKELY